MNELPLFIVLHSLNLMAETIEVGQEMVINPNYITGMFPAEARDPDTGDTRDCTAVALAGMNDMVHVVESPQDICDIILMAHGVIHGEQITEDPKATIPPYEAVVRDENPWEN